MNRTVTVSDGRIKSGQKTLFAGAARGVEILKIGKFTGMGGVKVEVTSRDLDEICGNFSGEHPDVPMVLGHYEDSPVFKGNLPTDTPAAGWARKIYRAGEKLLADVGDIPDLVGKWINAKAYRKVSVALMRGKNGMFLGHIGLLGARSPAVKGLEDFPVVSFADGEAGNVPGFVVVTEAGAAKGPGGGRVDRGQAIKKLQELGADPALFADDVPDAVVVKLADQFSAVKVEKDDLAGKLAKAQGDAAGAGSAKSLLEKAEAVAKDALAQLASERRTRLVERVGTVFSAAIKSGRMSPAEEKAMKPAALALVDQPAIIVELAGDDGKARKVTALEALLAGVEARPVNPMFTEGATDPEGKGGDPARDKVVLDAKRVYAESEAVRLAYPEEGEWVKGQVLAAGFKVEEKK